MMYYFYYKFAKYLHYIKLFKTSKRGNGVIEVIRCTHYLRRDTGKQGSGTHR